MGQSEHHGIKGYITILKDVSPHQDSNQKEGLFMGPLNSAIIFTSLDYNILSKSFELFAVLYLVISDMVALMEVKPENYQREFKIFEATTASLPCVGVRNKGGSLISL